jgi:hypothetical protein
MFVQGARPGCGWLARPVALEKPPTSLKSFIPMTNIWKYFDEREMSITIARGNNSLNVGEPLYRTGIQINMLSIVRNWKCLC